MKRLDRATLEGSNRSVHAHRDYHVGRTRRGQVRQRMNAETMPPGFGVKVSRKSSSRPRGEERRQELHAKRHSLHSCSFRPKSVMPMRYTVQNLRRLGPARKTIRFGAGSLCRKERVDRVSCGNIEAFGAQFADWSCNAFDGTNCCAHSKTCLAAEGAERKIVKRIELRCYSTRCACTHSRVISYMINQYSRVKTSPRSSHDFFCACSGLARLLMFHLGLSDSFTGAQPSCICMTF